MRSKTVRSSTGTAKVAKDSLLDDYGYICVADEKDVAALALKPELLREFGKACIQIADEIEAEKR